MSPRLWNILVGRASVPAGTLDGQGRPPHQNKAPEVTFQQFLMRPWLTRK